MIYYCQIAKNFTVEFCNIHNNPEQYGVDAIKGDIANPTTHLEHNAYYINLLLNNVIQST